MADASLIILGSASGTPNRYRACSGYLIECDRRLTLFDCGSGVARSFLNLGYDLLALDRIVISHTHPDHVSDLPLLIQYMHLSKRTAPVDIYLPEEFAGVFGLIIRAMYVIPERFAFEVCTHGYREGLIDNRPPTIEAVANWHLAKYTDDVLRFGLKNRMQSFSLKVVSDGFCVFYSGDVAGFDEIRRHAADCTLALIESSHVDLAEVSDFAKSHPDMTVVLTHFAEGGAEDSMRGELGKISTVVFAEDGMKIGLIPS